jgi:isoleucyl-tRNA synthetase
VIADGEEYPLTADDVQMVLQPLEGYQVERAGTHAVALNLELDDELIREGLAREAVRAIQNARKAAGLNVEDRIALALGGDEDLLTAIRAHEDYVAGEVLATSVAYNGAAAAEVAEIKGRELRIALERA